MKLLSFEIDGYKSFGAIVNDGVVDLQKRMNHQYVTLKDVLTDNGVQKARELIVEENVDYSLNDITYLSPINTPGKIICVGVNYNNRNAEYKDGSDLPKFPSIFMRTAASMSAGHKGNLIRPPESQQLDYEGEIALVIGKSGRRIAEENALDYVAGITAFNEGTIRDWVRHAKFNVTQGKNFPNTGAYGPWIVSMDEFDSEKMKDLRVTTRVNGEVRQNDTTASMMFPIAYLINYISTFTELHPGDVIATGTPTGAGARFDPPIYLKPGDVVEVEVEGVGTLVNGIADEVL